MIVSRINAVRGSVRTRQRPVLRRAVCVVVSTVSVLATCAGVTVSTAFADPATSSGCPRWTAVLVPGTWETSPNADPSQPLAHGLLRPIGDGSVARYGADIQVEYLPYAASIAPTYRASESDGVQALSGLLGGLCVSTRVILVGYSQGADAAGDMAARIGHGQGPIPASRVVAVGLVSDPRRNSSTPQLGSAVPGEGIAGPRDTDFGALAGRVRTVCARGDLYCGISPQASPALTAIGKAFTGSPAPITPSPASPGMNLSRLDPSEVTRQVVSVLAGLTETAASIPAVLGDLAQLPQLVAAVDIPGLHRVSGDLNNRFRPLVAMAAQVDLRLVAQALSLAAPLDSSGWTAVAARVVNILANIDISRAATDIGTAQEVGWRAAEQLAAGDPLGAGLGLTGLAPVAADLAAVTAAALARDAVGGQLADLAKTLTTATAPAITAALTDLAREATDAARFFDSGVHRTGYDKGLRQVLDWLITQIDATN